jgi:Lrp/AsnC family transcriptional regulator for asnA, asnC and gidA
VNEMDDIDRGIVRVLRDDGRISNREIARLLNVSEGTIRTRLRRLEETGRFRLVTLKHPASFGLQCMAYLMCSVKPQYTEEFADALIECKEFVFVSINLSRYNVFGVAVTKNRAALDRLIDTSFKNRRGYISSTICETTYSTRFDFHWTI